MEPIQIVSQFRQLAAEPGNRVFMAGECLPSVVTFLQLDPECARVALETLYCLALEPANVSTLESYPGLADAVTDWTINGVGATGEAAEKCLSVIFPSLDGDDATPAPGPEPAAAEPEATPTEVAAAATAEAANEPAEPAAAANTQPQQAANFSTSSFFTPTFRRRKTFCISVFVGGLTPDNEAAVEEVLLTIKGVVSFSFDHNHSCAVIWTNGVPQDIVDVIGEHGWLGRVMGGDYDGVVSAEVIPRADSAAAAGDDATNGGEGTSTGASIATLVGGASTDAKGLPMYALPKYTLPTFATSSTFTNPLTTTGDYSFAGREREAQRRRERKEAKVQSLLSKVGSWLW